MESITSRYSNSIQETIEKELNKSKSKNVSVKEILNETKPAFILIGNGSMMKEHRKDLYMRAIDMIEEVMNMDADEKFCFSTIKDKVEYSIYDKAYIYQVKITGKSLEKNKYKFSRGFMKLKTKDLAKRIGRSTYMINPLGIIPNKDFDKEYKIYFGRHPREDMPS